MMTSTTTATEPFDVNAMLKAAEHVRRTFVCVGALLGSPVWVNGAGEIEVRLETETLRFSLDDRLIKGTKLERDIRAFLDRTSGKD